MTRDEFEEWMDERRDDALDDVQQSDATPQKWLVRLYAALKAVADQEEANEDAEDDELFEDSEEEDDPEEEAANSNDIDEEA